MSRVAAIDCGTNSIRLLIADAHGGQLRDVHREMRIVRLGQGVDATGEFAPDAIARTRAALSDYAALLQGHGVERVRMVATSAARDVANRDVFFSMTADVLGAVFPGAVAEVITGAEEAALSFAVRSANWIGKKDLSSSWTLVVVRPRSCSAVGRLVMGWWPATRRTSGVSG